MQVPVWSRQSWGEGPPPLPVLYVDDEEENLELFRLLFADDFPVRTAQSGAEALDVLGREVVGLILTDERMPGMRGVDLLARIVQSWPNTVRIIVSAYCDADRLLLAINKGHAHEYVVKPWDEAEMRACLRRGLEMAQRRRHLVAQAETADALQRDLRSARNPDGIIGASGGLAATLAAARRAALSDATVLITGETGTGKELVARLLHEASPRARGAFVCVNCAALSEGVLESELFGHEQGAFTGAARARRGRFELAHGGTLLLDEIGDISLKLQVSLLRVLQEREVERVGGSRPIPVDVRVIAATHRDLLALCRQGRFREDLYYRLQVIPIQIPPLRDRPQDIPALFRHFVEKYGRSALPPRVAPDVLPALAAYAWPGNVRELENLVQRALVLSGGEELTLNDFCLTLAPPEPRPREQAQQAEREQLREVLLRHGGNCASAARALGVPRTTLASRAKKHGLL